MAVVVVYPPALPCPAEGTALLIPAERRQMSGLEGARVARAVQRDRLATRQVTFNYSFAQAATFWSWWRTTLIYGGAWFEVTDWPLPQGGISVVRFLGVPTRQVIPGFGWRLSAEVEVRGAGVLPTLFDEVSVTWEAATKGPQWTLSGGSLTGTVASLSVAEYGLRATRSASSGKRYFEVLLTHVGANALPHAPSFGVSTDDLGLYNPDSTALPGGTSHSWGYLKDGEKNHTAIASAYGSALGNGDIFMCAVDLDAGKIWFGADGTWFGSGNPAAGLNPAFSFTPEPLRPVTACNSVNDGTCIVTGRFALAALTYKPSGFTTWGAL
jgi:hypothetical protein